MKVTEAQIQRAYAGRETAMRYTGQRFANDLNRLLHRQQVTTVRSAIARMRPRRVLEVAPGPGRLTREVAAGFEGALTCLEFNAGMIEAGRSHCPPAVRWVRGNAFAMPFAPEADDQPFDLAYSFRFIRHFRRADRDRLYHQLARVLRPGGRLLFDAVNGRISRPIRNAAPSQYPIYDVQYDRLDTLSRELGEAGFTLMEARPVHRAFACQFRVQCLLGPRSRRLNRLALDTLERLSHGPGLEWIITARRDGVSTEMPNATRDPLSRPRGEEHS